MSFKIVSGEHFFSGTGDAGPQQALAGVDYYKGRLNNWLRSLSHGSVRQKGSPKSVNFIFGGLEETDPLGGSWGSAK